MTRDEYGMAYRKGFDLTVRLLKSRGVDSELACDVAQSAWTKGWERLSQLRQPSLVITWVNAIALNVYRSILRSSVELVELSPQDLVVKTSEYAQFDAEQILKNCRPMYRDVLTERYIYGNSVEDVARARGVTESTIRVRLLRARKQARKPLKIL